MNLAARRFAASFDSLVIGLPGVTIAGQDSAGAVVVVPGSRGGLYARASRLLTQDTAGVQESAENLDQLGHVSG